MYVRWEPENGEPAREWDFDPEDLLKSEGKLIEKQYGKSVEVWLNQLRIKELGAREVLLWHLLRQDHKGLRFDDVPDFRLRQLKVEMSSPELRDLMKRTERMKLSDDEREQLRQAFEIDIRDAMERETGTIEGEITTEEPNLPKPA
jgi:hypothetical protein